MSKLNKLASFKKYLKLVKSLTFSDGNDPALGRFQALAMIASRVLPEYKFKWPQMSWWDSKNFNNYLASIDESTGFNSDRRFMVSQLLRLTHTVPGDTAEVGVYRGSMSILICESNEKSQYSRQHLLIDSFAGLSAPDPSTDGSHWQFGDLSCGERVVRDTLIKFSESIKLYRGWVPEPFSDIGVTSFSFVHIDVDLYQPTLDSLAYFYEKINEGGILVCDDFGFTSCPGATKACKEFFLDKPEKMIGMSGGGGFIIKGVASAPDDYQFF